MFYKYWLLILLPISYCHALIVPQEIPSILSLIFSTIPQVKKGTDSRLGFGFRLGEHADLQVMLELGPQKETRPIGPDSLSQNSKRHVNQDDYDQSDEIITNHGNDKSKSKLKSTNKEAENWLKNWSNGMRSKRKKIIPTPPAIVIAAAAMNNNNQDNNENNDNNNIKVVPIISESALKQLQTLYGKNSSFDLSEEFKTKDLEKFQQKQQQQQQPSNKNIEKITAELSDVTLD